MQPGAAEKQAELPCVWVSAGVLSYRLCDRRYECETCPLYQALRGGGNWPVPAGPGDAGAGPVAGDPVGAYLTALGSGCTLHLDRAYSGEGMWLLEGPHGIVEAGMDDYTMRLLGPLDSVVLPPVGVWLRRGAPCAWLNRSRLSIALHMPIACELLEVLGDPLRTVRRDAATGGPWFRLKAHESLAIAPGLYRNEALLGWFLARVRSVHEQLDAVMHIPAAGTAPMLADGGRPLSDLSGVLGPERFEALVATLFPAQI